MAKPKNKSGVIPIEYNVIVLPDPVEEKTAGGIILADATIEQEQSGATRGVLVAISDLAFNYEPAYSDEKPVKIGDRVAYSRYAGAEIDGEDGEKYRVIKDKDIIGKAE